MDTLTVDDQIYLSSKRAAELTGYAKDYIGQLCREGRVKARLVGRSWYVLESSIRAHRFGSEETKKEEQRLEAEPLGMAWVPPTYISDTTHMLPPLRKSEDPKALEQAPPVTDMQAVWKEWFDTRVQHIDEAPNDQKSVVETRAEESAPTDEFVPVRRIEAVYEPTEEIEAAAAEEEYKEEEEPRSSGFPASIVRALALAFTVVVLAATLVGHGIFDYFPESSGISATVIRILDGTSIYKSD